MITTDQIKQLRDATGISIMQCRKALEASEGDHEKALFFLRKQGADVAEKKSERTLGAGVVAAYVHGGGALGALVVLRCETDFVAKNPEFKALAYDIAMHVAASSPDYVTFADISEETKEHIRALFAEEVEKSSADKPADIKKRILDGKIMAYFKEKTLNDQPFIKNPDIDVHGIVQAGVQKFGEKITIEKFVRLSAGGN